jgi:hypothetical protein
MKRNMVNTAPEMKCKLCDSMISTYGFTNHLKYTHPNEITVEEYVEQYGEYRKNKLNVKEGKRKIKKIQCKCCPCICSLSGFHTHLRDAHNLTPDQYVEKYGEYRPKQLDYKERAEQNQIQCLLCPEKFGSERLLTYHIRLVHKMNKMDYVKQIVFKNEIQVCKCGCGQRVALLNQPPYRVDYISGHNMKNNNK